MLFGRKFVVKSRRRAGVAGCPESLPRARSRYLVWLCLRQFICVRVSGQVTEHGLHGLDGFSRICGFDFRYILPVISEYHSFEFRVL